MKVMLDSGAYMPHKAHETDAGYDLFAMEETLVRAHSDAIFGTGVHIQLPKGTAGLVVSKSGLNTKHNITSTGLIDEGYTGEIVIKLYNHGSEDYTVHAGDKISQLVVINIQHEQLEPVTSLDRTDRGANGFGSTGR